MTNLFNKHTDKNRKWTKLNFGKHKGKTLPQVLFSDPDYFFWAIERKIFNNKGPLTSEAEELNLKARNIKIPNNTNNELIVEYTIYSPTEKFLRVKIIPADQPRHDGSSLTIRRKVFDMSFPRKYANYDKRGFNLLLSAMKLYLFGNQSIRFTKKLCEDFFNDDNNFT